MIQNRIRIALQALREQEKAYKDDLDTPEKAAAWNKVKLGKLDDIIMKYGNKLTESEKVYLQFAKADRTTLEKQMGKSRVSKNMRRLGNFLTKPFLRRIWNKRHERNVEGVSMQLAAMGIPHDRNRLSQYLNNDLQSLQYKYEKWLPGAQHMSVDFNIVKNEKGVLFIRGAETELRANGNVRTVNLDFHETGILDLGQLRALAQGKAILQERVHGENVTRPVWLQVKNVNNTLVLKQAEVDSRLEKDLASIPLSANLKIHKMLNLLKRGLDIDVTYRNGQRGYLSMDITSPHQVNTHNSAGEVIQRSDLPKTWKSELGTGVAPKMDYRVDVGRENKAMYAQQSKIGNQPEISI